MGKKSAKNVVEEWAKGIRKNAGMAYKGNGERIKNEYLQRIMGECDAILATLDCCENEE